MAYPNTNTKPKRLRVLEALQSALGLISSTGGFKHTVQRVHLYDADEVVLGDAMPSVTIVPDSPTSVDTRLSCAFSEYFLQATLIVAARVMPGSAQYKDDMHWLVADVTKALEDDSQLGGEAVSCLVDEVQVYDVGTNEPLALAEVRVDIRYRQAWQDPSA